MTFGALMRFAKTVNNGSWLSFQKTPSGLTMEQLTHLCAVFPFQMHRQYKVGPC